MMPADRPLVRCAIYTRKSSEEGLEQSFNSLDAQREACEAYVLSQRHEGWNALATRYDDGGFSGGSMERPALKALMADIEAGKIDLIVVYKVDRLTRSLSDFAKMVELFDSKKISFVSVTQQFNTTTSMGRLTLNVLLSFAQFEREVTGERIRDKIAASKKKGMWMGGYVPVGYDVVERKLVINPSEAAQLVHIFERYLALGCVSRLKSELDAHGIVSKVRTGRTGQVSGGLPYSRGALYELLRNRLYLGEIRHCQQHYPGQHEAIVSTALWERVQNRLSENIQGKRSGIKIKEGSLLVGLVFDESGTRLTPSHTVKNGKRYRYYVTPTGHHPKKRVPAMDLEQLVTNRINAFLVSEQDLLNAFFNERYGAAQQQALLLAARAHAQTWAKCALPDQRAFLQHTVAQICVKEDRVEIHLNYTGLKQALLSGCALPQVIQSDSPDSEIPRLPIVLESTASLARRGLEVRLVVTGEASVSEATRVRQSLIKAVARGRQWYEQLTSRSSVSLNDLAQKSGVNDRYASRILRFAFLAPDIVEAILEGKQPKGMTLEKTFTDMPLSWEKQRQIFGL
jgi:site-specific DNA recombinase